MFILQQITVSMCQRDIYCFHDFIALKILNIRKIAVIILKFKQYLYHRVMSPKDADGMANSVDLIRLLAQICLSENLGTLRQCDINLVYNCFAPEKL